MVSILIERLSQNKNIRAFVPRASPLPIPAWCVHLGSWGLHSTAVWACMVSTVEFLLHTFQFFTICKICGSIPISLLLWCLSRLRILRRLKNVMKKHFNILEFWKGLTTWLMNITASLVLRVLLCILRRPRKALLRSPSLSNCRAGARLRSSLDFQPILAVAGSIPILAQIRLTKSRKVMSTLISMSLVTLSLIGILVKTRSTGYLTQ